MNSHGQSPVGLVVFDLGRVLVRICDGWHHACRVAGRNVPAKDLDDREYAILNRLVHQSEVGDLDLHGFAEQAAVVLRLSARDVVAISNVYLLGTFPGALDLIESLAAKGIPTACLSNTNENHWRIMNDPTAAAWVPFDHFTHRFASHLARLRKPDPAIYEHVERNTGVAGDRIIFFDDAAENIEAATRRGWQPHRIEIGHDPIAQIHQCLQVAGVV